MGLSFELTNSLYVEDTTAPTVSDLNVIVVEIDGKQWLEITGKSADVSDTWDKYSILFFTFKAAEYPTSKVFNISFSLKVSEYDNGGGDMFYVREDGSFLVHQPVTDEHISGTYYLSSYHFYDSNQGPSVRETISQGGTGSPLLGLSFIYAEDPTDIDFVARSVDEKENGFLLGELIINGQGSANTSFTENNASSGSYNTAHLYTYSITGEDADLVEISPLGYLRIKSDVELYRYQDQTLDFTITATSPTGATYAEDFSLPVNAYQHTITYAAGTKPIAGITITKTESDGTITTLTTDANGQVTLPSTANTYTLSASYTAENNAITVSDALWILQSLVELRTLTADQIKAADINGDGNITIQDALKVLQHTVELTNLSQEIVFLDTATGQLLTSTTFNPGDTPGITVIMIGDVNQSYTPSSASAAVNSFYFDNPDHLIPITPDGDNAPYPIPFHDISLWAEEYDLELIELPWVADQTEVLTPDPLESLEGLLSLEDSVELDFSGFSGDPDDSVNAITVKTNTEALPEFYTEIDWKTILEDWVLSSELG